MRHKTLLMLLAVLMSMIANAVYAEEHEYVDLGLPSGTLWATCNVGAYSPEEYGNYYAWGETTTKTKYNWSTYKWCNGSGSSMTKYCSNSSYGYNGFTDTLTELELSDDAAYVNWGSDWCMASNEQWTELIDNCTWTWTTLNNVNGCRVRGSNGNSIFLPAAGYCNESPLYTGSCGDYYSRMLNTSVPNGAYGVYFNPAIYRFDDYRYRGRSVRPVRFVPASGVTLNYESYTFGRIGKTVQLEATVLPENASYKKVTWKSYNETVCIVSDGLVISTGEGTTVISATTADGEHVAYCTITVELMKCATPTIDYKNGKLTFASETEGVQFESEITDTDIKQYNEAEINLSVTYTIHVRATHKDYSDSDEAIATLCWIDADPKMEGIENGVAQVRANAVLIQSNNGTVSIAGVTDGTNIAIYSSSGMMVGSAKSSGALTSIATSLRNGEIAIVKIGDKAIKVVMR